MGSKRKLVVHVGAPKTGTTSIQFALMRGDITAPGGIDYPAPRNGFNHNHLGYDISPLPAGASKPAQALLWSKHQFKLAQLGRALRRGTSPTAIVSGEVVALQDPARLKSAIDRHLGRGFDEVQILLYLRPHIAAVTSYFSERCKMGGFFGDFESFVAAKSLKRFEYATYFAPWRDVFGEALTIRPMIKSALLGGSVLRDFAETALAGREVRVDETRAANPSLSVKDLMRLRVIHKALGPASRKAHHALGWTFSDHLLSARSAADTPPVMLKAHKSLAQTLHARFAEDAARTDAAFFGGAPLFAQALDQDAARAVDAPIPFTVPDWLTPSEIDGLRALAKVLRDGGGAPDTWADRLRQTRADHLAGRSWS